MLVGKGHDKIYDLGWDTLGNLAIKKFQLMDGYGKKYWQTLPEDGKGGLYH